MGRRRYSADLPQGGLEVPCKLQFAGRIKELDKLQRLLDSFSGKDAKLQDDTASKDSTVETPEQVSTSRSADTCSSEKPQAAVDLTCGVSPKKKRLRLDSLPSDYDCIMEKKS